KSNRQKECVQMPGKMARSDPRPPFGPPVVRVAARSSCLASRELENRYYSRHFGSHLGNVGLGKLRARAGTEPPQGTCLSVCSTRLNCEQHHDGPSARGYFDRCPAALDVGGEAADRGGELQRAAGCVGDGAAEWVVCEPIVHLAPAGPSRAAY